MRVRIVERPIGVANSQGLARGLTVRPVVSSGQSREVRGLVDEGPSLGVGTGGRCLPERTAEVDNSIAVESGVRGGEKPVRIISSPTLFFC